jgi:hypothetical protein
MKSANCIMVFFLVFCFGLNAAFSSEEGSADSVLQNMPCLAWNAAHNYKLSAEALHSWTANFVRSHAKNTDESVADEHIVRWMSEYCLEHPSNSVISGSFFFASFLYLVHEKEVPAAE